MEQMEHKLRLLFSQTVPNCFIVGYGIDFDQQYRQLPAIYALEE